MANHAEGESENTNKLEDGQQRDWASLHTDLLCLMLPRLFLRDVKRFHGVCRSWQLTPTTSVQSPVLMCIGNDSTRCKFFHPLYKGHCSMIIPELFGAIPRFSKDGWLLMTRGDYSIFFFNPFTKALIDLPDLPERYQFGRITFTSSPTSSDCMVFGIDVEYDVYFSIATICRGEESWDVFHGECDSPISLSPCNPVFHNGKFYCLGQHGNLGVFTPEENYWRVLDNPCPQPLDSRNWNFLVEGDGVLLLLCMSFMGELISVSKLNGMEMQWHKVDSLGDQMLFVSSTTSLSAKGVVQGMENKIYLPRISGKCVVYYSIANNLLQTSGNHFSQKNLYGTGEPLKCCWIEPKDDTYSEEELIWFSESKPPRVNLEVKKY